MLKEIADTLVQAVGEQQEQEKQEQQKRLEAEQAMEKEQMKQGQKVFLAEYAGYYQAQMQSNIFPSDIYNCISGGENGVFNVIVLDEDCRWKQFTTAPMQAAFRQYAVQKVNDWTSKCIQLGFELDAVNSHLMELQRRYNDVAERYSLASNEMEQRRLNGNACHIWNVERPPMLVKQKNISDKLRDSQLMLGKWNFIVQCNFKATLSERTPRAWKVRVYI